MKAGFARLDITPPLGCMISGYYHERIADGIIDNLYANAVAFSDGERTAVVIALDLIGIWQNKCDIIRRIVSERNGIPCEAVYIHCTHTHLGPEINGRLFKVDEAYNDCLFRRISDAAALAIADMKDAALEIACGEAKGIAFVRRYRMKDGSTRTNPGNDPDVVAPIGTPDETVQLVKIKREGAADIAIVNFQVHPDTISGTRLCADYPGFVRRTLEGALAAEKGNLGVHCVYINGAQGDTNHVDRLHPDHGLRMSEHMGRVIAGGVLSVYSRTKPVASDGVFFGQKNIEVSLSKGTTEQVEAARKLVEAYEKKGYDAVSAGMLGVTEVAEAKKFVRLADGPDTKKLLVSGVRVGDVAFVGMPGEPFTDVGRGIKAGSPFAMTVISCCTNGYEGYYPMKSAFDEGGYEARSSSFEGGVAETLIDTGLALANELKKNLPA